MGYSIRDYTMSKNKLQWNWEPMCCMSNYIMGILDALIERYVLDVYCWSMLMLDKFQNGMHHLYRLCFWWPKIKCWHKTREKFSMRTGHTQYHLFLSCNSDFKQLNNYNRGKTLEINNFINKFGNSWNKHCHWIQWVKKKVEINTYTNTFGKIAH